MPAYQIINLPLVRGHVFTSCRFDGVNRRVSVIVFITVSWHIEFILLKQFPSILTINLTALE
jgi:hypothetical protein